jgi:hypothetical protein
MDRVQYIEKFGITARGKQELIRHLKGDRLTMKQAILANCYDCMGGYGDGKTDCRIPGCPLYRFMSYREDKEMKTRKERTKKQIDSTARLTLIRAAARRKGGL